MLVDVDPLSAYVLQGFEGGPNDLQDCTLIADTLQYLVMDTMRLEQKLDRVSLAREDIYTFLDIIPDTVSTVITQLKHDLRRALDTNDLALLQAINHEDDWDEEKSGYWFLFMERAHLPLTVEDFSDDEAIQRHINRLGE
ncbi:MAG TPA: hypothetical protein VFZ58_03945 [Candidatus Saccharimonadales bacterium]